jgi:prophage antirepressor-like protein
MNEGIVNSTTPAGTEGVALPQPLMLATPFEGKEIHTFECNGEVWFPLADLATAWGIDRKTPGNLIGRNHALFKGMFLSDGDVTYHDVSERGLYLLMGKISADRLKNPEAKEALIRFQRWVPELIQKYRKGNIVRTTAVIENPLADSLNRHADIADILTARYGYKPEIARNLAMEAVVMEQGDKAIIYRGPALPPVTTDEELEPAHPLIEGADPDFDKYFSLTKVAEYCDCTTDQARNILEKEGVLEYSNKLWHLTRYGEGFGKTFTTMPWYPHRLTEKKMIRYSPVGVDLVRKHMAASQSELPLKVQE